MCDILVQRGDQTLVLAKHFKDFGIGAETDAAIREMFGDDERIIATLDKDTAAKNEEEALIEIYKRLRPGEPPTVDSARTLLNNLFFDPRRYDPVTPAMMAQIKTSGIATVEVVDVSVDNGTLIKTLREDAKAGIHNEEDALKEVYKRMRPGDPPTATNSKQMLHRMFFELAHYDLGYVGRHKINKRLGLVGKVDENLRTLHESGIDVIEAIRLLLKIYVGKDVVDDIDHLGNRRIRTTGELLENQCRIGLARTERLIRERMTVHDANSGPLTPS